MANKSFHSKVTVKLKFVSSQQQFTKIATTVFILGVRQNKNDNKNKNYNRINRFNYNCHFSKFYLPPNRRIF